MRPSDRRVGGGASALAYQERDRKFLQNLADAHRDIVLWFDPGARQEIGPDFIPLIRAA